jgi:hypothetical protein
MHEFICMPSPCQSGKNDCIKSHPCDLRPKPDDQDKCCGPEEAARRTRVSIRIARLGKKCCLEVGKKLEVFSACWRRVWRVAG